MLINSLLFTQNSNNLQKQVAFRIMSISSMAYREVDTIVSSWTEKYQYHISMLENKQDIVRQQQKQARFMVEFSLTKPQKPIPVGTVRVYFTCNCEQNLTITFRFEKDSLIHSVDKTIRHGEIQKWIDDALARKLLVRETVFYLGTSYEETRVRDQRLDKILYKPPKKQEEEYTFIHPDLLCDQERSIKILQRPQKDLQKQQNDLKKYFREIDKENIGIVTRPEFVEIIKNIGLSLTSDEQKQALGRVDPSDTGMVDYSKYSEIISEILEALEAKKTAENMLHSKKDNQEFFAILCFLNDEVQNIDNEILQHFTKQDEDQTGLTNISEVKTLLESINRRFKEQKKEEPLSPIELAEITKILTEKYGYKEIPYAKIHQHIIDYKINVFSNGLTNAEINKLELYIREICDQFDEKKFGRVSKSNFIKAIQNSQKIKLTRAQVYLLENIVPLTSKNEVNYVESSKFISEVIKKFYIHSSKKQNNA